MTPYPENLRLRPSSAHSWMVCTAGPRFCAEHAAELPESESVYASEGSQAHEAARKMLEGKEWSCPQDMADHARGYADRCKASIGIGDTTFVEASVPLWYMPERTGRIDFIRVSPTDEHLLIRDFKYGEGVVVEAEQNEQLAIYAWSFIVKHQPEFGFAPGWTITLEIDQPRTREGEPVKSWTTTFDELGLFCARIGAVARKILADEDTEFAPGGACRFCDAKGICPARGNQALAVLPEDTAMQLGGLPPATGLTDDQIRRIVEAKPQLIEWLDSIEAHVYTLLSDGREVPGFKLVEGRSNRAWTDEAEAATKLRAFIPKDKLWSQPKFITPAQAEKALKKPLKPVTARLEKALERLITKPEGKPVLALESDPRPAIVINPLEGLVDETYL